MDAVTTVAVVLLLVADPVAPTDPALKAAGAYSADHRGQACVVLFDGRVVFERYDGPGAADRKGMLASGSKSLVGLAAVAAVGDGLIRLDDRVATALKGWNDDPAKAKVTYRQLLTLTGGLTPGEIGSAGRKTWAEVAAEPAVGTPGERFAYGPNPIITFAHALEQKLDGETFEAYLKRRVLDPIGAEVVWRSRCRDGRPQVAGGGTMTARDWAKVGELVRLGGRHRGKAVLDPTILAESFRGSAPNPAYGLTWWLRRPVTAGQARAVPLLRGEWGEVADADWLPPDLVAACGAGKQRLYVIPSRKLVVARQGAVGLGFSDVAFLRLLLTPPETATGR